MKGRKPLEGPLRVVVHAMMTGDITGKPDADNLGKAALDALNKIVFNDDCQVVDLRVLKIASSTPSLRIQIESISSI